MKKISLFFLGRSFGKELTDQESLQNIILLEGLYACFTVHGKFKVLREAWGYIYGSWIPNSGRALLFKVLI